MFSNRVEFAFKSPLGTKVFDYDLIGWNNTEKDIKRSEKTFGIFITQTNGLQFTGEAKQWLEGNYTLYGPNAEVEITKKEKHPTTDDWRLSYTASLDFTTRKIEGNKLILDFVEGSLREVFVSQIREKFELNRIESIKGASITALETDILSNKGRDIYLLSKFKERITFFTTKSGRWESVDENRPSFHPIPLTVSANVDNTNVQEPQESYKAEERYDQSLLNMFFSVADRDRGLTRFSGKATFKVEGTQQPNMNSFDMNFVLKRFTSDPDGTNLVFQDILFTFPMGDPAPGTEFIIDVPEIILYPLLNESYALGFEMMGQYGSGFPLYSDGFKNINFIDLKANFSWAEDSFYKRTNAPFLTAYEVGQRLTEIYTGKKIFTSNLLSEGAWKDLGFTCGGWIRNLKIKTETEEEKEWPLSISFEDFYNSIHAILPVGYGIGIQGNKQFIILEKIQYFFQPIVTVKIGKATNIKRETATEFIFSSITTGFTKGGNYEEPLGLDEYNIQATNTTPITKLENKYEVLGSSRADTYEIERMRRKQSEDFAEEDMTSDKDNFLIDAKFLQRSNFKNYYEVRLWQDDFEKSPTGVYSPETAFNLRLSPANNKQRHSFWFNNSLYKYPNDKLRFSSTEGNSQLATKLIGKPEIKENADTLISELLKPIFEPEWINLEIPLIQGVLDQLEGSTIINGNKINNFYGLVEFINERNYTETGYLFSAKVKDKISFKLLKSYGV